MQESKGSHSQDIVKIRESRTGNTHYYDGQSRKIMAPSVADSVPAMAIGDKLVIEQKRNTKNLSSRFAVDAACAATAGGLVAPLITIVDQ